MTGTGGAFTPDMDLKAFARSGERPVNERRGTFGIVALPPEKPLIAAVEGSCLRGGFEMALACDLIVAGEDAVFGPPEVARGLMPLTGGLVRLPRRPPRNVAEAEPLAVRASKRMIATTEALDEESAFAAQEALVAAVRGSRDAEEDTRAFVEKRAPRWQGR